MRRSASSLVSLMLLCLAHPGRAQQPIVAVPDETPAGLLTTVFVRDSSFRSDTLVRLDGEIVPFGLLSPDTVVLDIPALPPGSYAVTAELADTASSTTVTVSEAPDYGAQVLRIATELPRMNRDLVSVAASEHLQQELVDLAATLERGDARAIVEQTGATIGVIETRIAAGELHQAVGAVIATYVSRLLDLHAPSDTLREFAPLRDFAAGLLCRLAAQILQHSNLLDDPVFAAIHRRLKGIEAAIAELTILPGELKAQAKQGARHSAELAAEARRLRRESGAMKRRALFLRKLTRILRPVLAAIAAGQSVELVELALDGALERLCEGFDLGDAGCAALVDLLRPAALDVLAGIDRDRAGALVELIDRFAPAVRAR